jgi:hypothetical protein
MAKQKWGIKAIRDKTVLEATGKSWEEWFEILDKWGGGEKRHNENAKYLREEQGLSAWWSNAVAFRYEWEKGFKQ